MENLTKVVETQIDKLTNELAKLGEYAPHAWKQLVGHKLADSISGVFIGVILLGVAVWIVKNKEVDPSEDFSFLYFVALVLCTVFGFIFLSSFPSIFYPEGAVIKDFLQ